MKKTEPVAALSRKDIDRNFWMNALDGAFFMGAIAIVPQATILPAYVAKFTSNEYLINLIPALAVLGSMGPQLFVARHTETLRYKKARMLLTGWFQRIPWLVLAVASCFVFPGRPWIPLVLFFTIYSVYSVSGGLNMPVWSDLVAKVVPRDRRGRLFAWRNGLGAALGVAGASAATGILTTLKFPYNYSALFGIFFVLTTLSLIFLYYIKEPPSLEVKAKQELHGYLRSLPGLVRADRNYGRFIVSSVLLALAGLSGGLVAKYGIVTFDLGAKDWVFGRIALLSVLVQLATIFLFGRLGDRRGHKINLMIGSSAMVLAMTGILFIPHNIGMFYVYYGLQSLAMSAFGVSSFNILFEFCAEKDRPTYVSLRNTVTAPVSFIAPMVGAFLVRGAGFKVLFSVALGLYLLNLLFLGFMVREPRKRVHTLEPVSPGTTP
jgi:MFS family permease